MQYKDEPEFESGQILIDKEKCWKALNLTMWMNEYSDLYYKHIHGDKETFHLAFRKINHQYAMTKNRVILKNGVMYQHDFNGKVIFQHRNGHKWSLDQNNPRIYEFKLETECLAYLDTLKNLWNGEIADAASPKLNGNAVNIELLNKPWIYKRVGFDARPMSFLINGFIGTGKAKCENRWEVIEKDGAKHLNISGEEGLICSLQYSQEGNWQGKWLKYEQMPIELLPLQ